MRSTKIDFEKLIQTEDADLLEQLSKPATNDAEVLESRWVAEAFRKKHYEALFAYSYEKFFKIKYEPGGPENKEVLVFAVLDEVFANIHRHAEKVLDSEQDIIQALYEVVKKVRNRRVKQMMLRKSDGFDKMMRAEAIAISTAVYQPGHEPESRVGGNLEENIKTLVRHGFKGLKPYQIQLLLLWARKYKPGLDRQNVGEAFRMLIQEKYGLTPDAFRKQIKRGTKNIDKAVRNLIKDYMNRNYNK